MRKRRWMPVGALGCVAAAVLAASPTAAATVGSVTYIKNLAYGTPPAGEKVRKIRGDGIVSDEALETFPGGALIVTLLDQTELTLGENSTVTVDRFVFDPGSKRGREVVDLVKGALYFASGNMASRDVTIRTPVVTLGVRGTEFSVTLTDDGEVHVGVVSGEVSMTTGDGRRETARAGSTLSAGPGGGPPARASGIRNSGNPAVDRRAALGIAGLTRGPGRGNFGRATGRRNGRGTRPGMPASGPLPGGGLFGGIGGGGFFELPGLRGSRPGGPPGGPPGGGSPSFGGGGPGGDGGGGPAGGGGGGPQ